MAGKYTLRPRERMGFAAILAVLTMLAGFTLACSGQGAAAVAAHVVSIGLGVVGFVRSASARVTGGILSLVAIGGSLIGVLLGVLVWLTVITWNAFR